LIAEIFGVSRGATFDCVARDEGTGASDIDPLDNDRSLSLLSR
jgi:predicted nucleotidyltransferase